MLVHVLVAYASSEGFVETVQTQGLWDGCVGGFGVEAVSAGRPYEGSTDFVK